MKQLTMIGMILLGFAFSSETTAYPQEPESQGRSVFLLIDAGKIFDDLQGHVEGDLLAYEWTINGVSRGVRSLKLTINTGETGSLENEKNIQLTPQKVNPPVAKVVPPVTKVDSSTVKADPPIVNVNLPATKVDSPGTKTNPPAAKVASSAVAIPVAGFLLADSAHINESVLIADKSQNVTSDADIIYIVADTKKKLRGRGDHKITFDMPGEYLVTQHVRNVSGRDSISRTISIFPNNSADVQEQTRPGDKVHTVDQTEYESQQPTSNAAGESAVSPVIQTQSLEVPLADLLTSPDSDSADEEVLVIVEIQSERLSHSDLGFPTQVAQTTETVTREPADPALEETTQNQEEVITLPRVEPVTPYAIDMSNDRDVAVTTAEMNGVSTSQPHVTDSIGVVTMSKRRGGIGYKITSLVLFTIVLVIGGIIVQRRLYEKRIFDDSRRLVGFVDWRHNGTIDYTNIDLSENKNSFFTIPVSDEEVLLLEKTCDDVEFEAYSYTLTRQEEVLAQGQFFPFEHVLIGNQYELRYCL